VSPRQALALVVHASVVLCIGQMVVTPIHYVRESLTSPFNLAAIVPLIEVGSLPAKAFGAIDLFALWWTGLVALSLSVLTGRRPGRYLWPMAALYGGFGAAVAAIMTILGGS
jgi:hypothetical protein